MLNSIPGRIIVKYGLIGCGRISKNHIKAALKSEMQIAGLCDIDTSKVLNVIKDNNLDSNVLVFDNYMEMINAFDFDLIAVATDSGSHFEIASACIKKGINVLIEKPMAMSVSDAEKLIQLGKDFDVKIGVCHQNRFNKSIQKLRQSIDDEKLGNIHYGSANVRWFRDENYYKEAAWRGTVDRDGGVLMNQAIHNIDLLLWMLGGEVVDVKSVTSNFIHPYIETEDFGAALITLSNGSYGIIEATTSTFPKNLEETLYVFGEKGTVKIGGYSVNRIDEWIVAGDIDSQAEIKSEFSEEPENIYGNGHVLLYKDMVESIHQNRNPYISGEEGIKALKVIREIYNQNKK